MSTSTLVNRLAEELARRWHAGERPLVEEYLARYPELAARPEEAAELIYEELCLRQELGAASGAEEVLRRFPQWRDELQVLIRFHDFLEPIPVTPDFPAPGARVGDFKLLAELGRGAHGRVFLATQTALADRPVALKFVPRSGQEHLALARLQHTHIVPLYSIEDDPARGWRALCMPYFGGATLAQLLERLAAIPLAKRTGNDLPKALADAGADLPLRIPVEGPACQFLARVSYARGICWLGVCLAEALEYTHERGLLHLDLKPSNILWAADGQPMLLDLHLAKPPIAAGTAGPTWLGGTPAYMAPEHRLAMAAVDAGQKVLTAIDGRADIYALGLVLAECLGGGLPPRGQKVSGWLLQRNPQVSANLASILEKCLADEPRDRFPSASALAEELRRHLAERTMPAVAKYEPHGRRAGWRRPVRPIIAWSIIAVCCVAVLWGASVAHQNRMNEVFSKARARIEANQAASPVTQLHQVVQRLKKIDAAPGALGDEGPALADLCRSLLEKRALIIQQIESLSAPERAQVRDDLLDLAILSSNLRERLARERNARREPPR